MSSTFVTRLETVFEKIRKYQPHPLSKEMAKLFEEVRNLFAALKNEKPSKKPPAAKNTFSFVKLIQQVLKTQDILFLNRRLSYHVVATSDLPTAHGSPEEALAVLSELLSAMARYAAPGSKLEIAAQPASLREGPAIQIRLGFSGKPLKESERKKMVEELYGAGMTQTKTFLRHVGGEFWLAFPGSSQAVLTFHWPAFERKPAQTPSGFGTYKYDIWLTDYGKIRQRFGIEKAEKLVRQVEESVRSLVRHPVDIVIGFPEEGMITAIYESQEGVASSVATRISARLGKEHFRIGRKSIAPKFRYQMTFLT